MKSQTAYSNLRKAMAAVPATTSYPEPGKIYVNFKGQTPVEVMDLRAAWAEVRDNPQLELESIEEWWEA